MFDQIQIPKELLPLDGRFGCGPSLVRPEFIDALAKEAKTFLGTSHRQAPVKNKVGSVLNLLRSYLKIPSDYKIAMGNGSASQCWDMITFGVVEKKSAHFVNGEFSSKWHASVQESKFVQAHLVKSPVGEVPAFQEFADCDVHCITWNETSTGAMWPGAPVKSANTLLAVDATSAAGALSWDWTNTDIFYFSPQKAFGSDGGLWIGVFSPKAVERIEKIKKSGRYIPAMLDFSLALKNAESNQTYNTPSLMTLYVLEKQLHWFQERGIDKVTQEQNEKTKLLHTWVDSRKELFHYVKNSEWRSKTVSTINLLPEIPFDLLTKQLRKFGAVDIDAYRSLGENQIRISLFPNISRDDLGKLTKCIDYLLDNRKA
jgi:phosphoserine aminotransferase